MIVFQFVFAFFIGGFIGFTLAALLAMGGNIARDEEIDALRRQHEHTA